MEKTNTKTAGNKGEEIAAEYIKKNGYTIIEQNYRSGKGEIDIIATDNETGYLTFIEVKYRKSLEYGEPEFAVTKTKQLQIKKIASAYLQEKNITDCDCRFDVAAILDLPGKTAEINYYKNAFS